MQNNTKNDGISWGAMAHSAQRLRGPWPRFVTTGVVNLKKKPLFWEEKILMLWILRSRNASTNTIIFFIITVGKSSSHCQPREHLEQGFFQPTERAWMFFFGQRSYAGSFSYLYALPGYTVYMYICFLKSTSPSPPPPRPPQKWCARQTVEFPTSHISFVTQHVLHVPVTGNISSHMLVLCIRNFVTFAGLLNKTGKWPLLKIWGQWAMRFSDISGHRRIRICIVLPVFFYRDYE